MPVVGDVPAATALLFDFGVFALVVGATIVVLIALAHQSLRTGRARALEEEAEPEVPREAPAAAEGS